MIETYDNALQLIVTCVCCIYAVIRAFSTRKRAWTLYALYCAAYFFGDLYWYLYLIIYDDTPLISYIPDLSWFAAYLFLILLLQSIRGKTSSIHELRNIRVSWIGPAFAAVMGVFFMTKGDYLSNIITAVLMGLIMLIAMNGIRLRGNTSRAEAPDWYIYRLVMVFCGLEYLLWISSYFWMGDTPLNPYFWIDMLITITIAMFIPSIRRVVGE